MENFDFELLVGSATAIWNITHNMNTDAVAVDVFVDVSGTLTKILPQNIERVTVNLTRITFSGPQFGQARVIGLKDAV